MMQKTQDISISDYDYNLPNERIAKFPLPVRDASKLLVCRKNSILEDTFRSLADYIPEGSLMIFNNTKVIQARLTFQKTTGAQIEIFCLEPVEPADYAMAFAQTNSVVWLCMVGNLKKWKEKTIQKQFMHNGRLLTFIAELIVNKGLTHHVRFSWDDDSVTFSELLEIVGELPIPPYLQRKTREEDKKTYQTVYSKVQGSVAAPTAGLHFTPEVLDALQAKNISTEELTLHVGAGTFHPVKSESIGEHEMHTELFSIQKSLIKKILANLGHIIIAVGTTSVRTLESLYYIGLQLEKNPHSKIMDITVTQWMPYADKAEITTEKALQNIIAYLDQQQLDSLQLGTQIMIVPGFQFRVVSGIVTNFHQPRSTLLLLVSAFIGKKWKDVYNYALSHDFRFLSYGDSSLLF
jgi:S-adenosylmethionine:tRNA ribosyltransferase-isomerase